MSDVVETYKAMAAHSKQIRDERRTKAPAALTRRGIEFESKNEGAHLIVKGPHGLIDYWPGTGRWIDRSKGKGFGFRELIVHIVGG
jgi:hypothetical protein